MLTPEVAGGGFHPPRYGDEIAMPDYDLNLAPEWQSWVKETRQYPGAHCGEGAEIPQLGVDAMSPMPVLSSCSHPS
jgi:hypothetical protein